MRIWAFNECHAHFEYGAKARPRVRHYQSSGRSRVEMVIEAAGRTTGVVLSDEEAPGTYTLRAAEAFLKNVPGADAVVLAPVQTAQSLSAKIQVLPWAGMC